MNITQSKLKEVLHYDTRTGVFRWIAPRKAVRVGDKAGCVGRRGVVRIKIDGRMYMAHRLAWLFIHGELPNLEIDHIDGNPSNNAIENLREATRSQNMQNLRGPYKRSPSRKLGASYRYGKWRSSICINGVKKFLGAFDTEELAHEAYVNAKRIVHAFCTI